jgi:integrase/recombinase XerD
MILFFTVNLRDYMRSKGQNLYDETVGEKYLLDMLQKGNVREYRLKQTKHSINLINDILNQVPVRKKRVRPKTFPLPGEFGKHIQSFLEQLKIECRPARHTLYMYITALSHFAVRMQQDCIGPDNLDNIAISRFVSSLQNTQLRVCRPVRRFLRYLSEKKVTKTDLSIPLFNIKSHRAEKLPSLYNIEEIRRMDASIEKTGRTGKRDYAIFLLASRLGLRASDICQLQFRNLDWDRNVINLVQCKTKKKIELPLLGVIGEAIIDYVQNGRPKSDSKTIFLTAKAPYTPISVPGLSSIVSGIIYKAGIGTKDRRHGAHCLRHSLATQLKWMLLEFDKFFTQTSKKELFISSGDVKNWTATRTCDKPNTLYQKYCAMADFCHYMCLLGYECYIPRRPKKCFANYAPTIFTHEQMRAIFNVCDNLIMKEHHAQSIMIIMPALIRILYSTGMFHEIRHSAAVHSLIKLTQDGVDIYCSLPLLATFMGHKKVLDTETFGVYGKAVNDKCTCW